jgi:2-oxoglutarate dehydrogenase E2 component (dihydrolipoamide succinyltransferase)
MANVVEIRMPPLQEGTESVVAGWLKKLGDSVTIHEPLVEINTDKAITEVAAPATGVLLEIAKDKDEKIEPGDLLGRIQLADGVTAKPAQTASPPATRRVPQPATAAAANLSPAVRNLLKEHGIDPARIQGSGRGGRITHEDVLAYLKSQEVAAKPKAASELRGRRVPHTQMRRRIAEHMVASMLKAAPHVTAVWEVDCSAIVRHRQIHRADFEKQGIHLTYTTYFVAASVQALQAVPQVNSRWHEDGLEMFDDCNIGIATAIEGGLIVPVIRRAQTLDLIGVAKALQDLTDKARRGKLELAEIQNGTFTITNHGVSGSLIATAVINQPQSAILGVGKMEKRAQVIEIDGRDAIEPRPMMYVTLTIDHRVLDGFQANTFLGKWVQTIAEWQ